jgi:hypothetical protein
LLLATVDEQVNVAMPEPFSVEGEMDAQVSPDGAVAVSVTLLEKPFRLERVILVELEEEAWNLTMVGLTVIVKSWIEKLTMIE